MVINHLAHITDLTPSTTYRFRVMSRDMAGNLATSDEHTFTTLRSPTAVFTSSRLSISPGEVNIGETVTISVLITNTGSAAGSYKVAFKINGVVEATKDITLNVGASEEVTFTTAKDVAGSYSVDVDGLSGSFTVVPLAAFSVSYLSIEPAEVQPNEMVTITVFVANTGGTEGSYTVVLMIDDVKEAEKSITVAAGSSQDVSFSVTKADAGSYSVAIDGLRATFTVVSPPAPMVNWPLILGIIAGVVAVGVTTFVVLRKRRA